MLGLDKVKKWWVAGDRKIIDKAMDMGTVPILNSKGILLIIFLIFALLTGIVYVHQKEVEFEHQQKTQSLLNSAKVNVLDTMNQELEKESHLIAQEIGKRLTEEINLQYPNKSLLLKEFKTKSYSRRFTDLLSRVIEANDYRNYLNGASPEVLIGIPDGLFYGKTLRFCKSPTQLVTWKEEASAYRYQGSLESIFKDIIDQNDLNLIYPDDIVKPENIIQPLTVSNLRRVFMLHGYDLELMKGYRFVSVVYVYNNRDIFGNPDYLIGNIRNENYKFIIIITYNLYDYLDYNYRDLMTLIEHDNTYITTLEYSSVMSEIVIIILFLLVIVIVYSVIILERSKMLFLFKSRLGEEEFNKRFEEETIHFFKGPNR